MRGTRNATLVAPPVSVSRGDYGPVAWRPKGRQVDFVRLCPPTSVYIEVGLSCGQRRRADYNIRFRDALHGPMALRLRAFGPRGPVVSSGLGRSL